MRPGAVGRLSSPSLIAGTNLSALLMASTGGLDGVACSALRSTHPRGGASDSEESHIQFYAGAVELSGAFRSVAPHARRTTQLYGEARGKAPTCRTAPRVDR